MTAANHAQSQPGSFVAGAEERTESLMPALRRAWDNYWSYRHTLADLRALSRRNLDDLGFAADRLKAIAYQAVYGN